MNPNKAPESNGMAIFFFFFCQFWEIVGTDVIVSMQDFFKLGRLLLELNHTNLVLIPKTDNPSLVGRFCPISLTS